MGFTTFQKEQRGKIMPSGEEIAEMAQKQIKIDKDKIEANFNQYLNQLLSKEFDIYKGLELECSKKIISSAMEKGLLVDEGDFPKSFIKNYHYLDKFFLSITQSRRTRAGGSFEIHVRYLFNILDYPYDRQTDLNGTVDYVIPSKSAFKRRRSSCVVISIKRTLRERWRQVIGELKSTNAGKIYMLTTDDDIGETKVQEMKSHNIILVVWDEIKDSKLKKYDNVIGFTNFINQDLPASRKLWEDLV